MPILVRFLVCFDISYYFWEGFSIKKRFWAFFVLCILVYRTYTCESEMPLWNTRWPRHLTFKGVFGEWTAKQLQSTIYSVASAELYLCQLNRCLSLNWSGYVASCRVLGMLWRNRFVVLNLTETPGPPAPALSLRKSADSRNPLVVVGLLVYEEVMLAFLCSGLKGEITATWDFLQSFKMMEAMGCLAEYFLCGRALRSISELMWAHLLVPSCNFVRISFLSIA